MAYTTINKPSEYFNTVLWSGDGTSPRTITGVGFQPEWVWLKHRSGTGTRDHYLSDVVRGATNSLNSNTTDAEVATESNGYTSAFASDGFTLTSGSNSIGDVNDSARSYVAWNWLAGGSASSNTDGSITSSVSANTTSGFSIVSFTGTGANATVGHGLGSAPKMVIFKNRDNGTQEWDTYHAGLTDATYFVQLNSTNAQSNTNGALRFNSTAPTSSVFSVGTATTTNESSSAMIAYCFAEKKGFSKFGLYTGNGDTGGDGTFVYCGFKPAFVMVKRTNGAFGWVMIDNKRSTPSGNNLIDKSLFADTSGVDYAPGSGWVADFLSNGFKFRMTANHSAANGNGDPYIYMAFAENPLVTTGKVPATAR